MPYRIGKKWMAQVRINNKKKRKLFTTKKEALAWEVRKLEETSIIQEKVPEINTVSLLEWANQYLDFRLMLKI